ncbi:MAG TPA: hypothetical protein VGI12_09895 [Vicinamibacterales bacterium]
MSTALAPSHTSVDRWDPSGVPAFPWRDPATIPRTDLVAYIREMEMACAENPASPVLWTRLGMAHAVNFDVPNSMTALARACDTDPLNFWARLKHGELHYRLRTLQTAEDETLAALALADNPIQLSIARRQLRDIRATGVPTRRGPGSIRGLAVFLSGLSLCAYLALHWG